MSAFFEARQEEYYETLLAVSRDDDWTGWAAFFLEVGDLRTWKSNEMTALKIASHLYQPLLYVESMAEMADQHVLFQDEDKETYMGALLGT